MTAISHTGRRVALVAALVLLTSLGHISAGRAQGVNGTISLQGIISGACNITVTARPAATALPLTGSQHIYVGDIAQNCNDAGGYTLSVSSANCGGTPTGAKLESSIFDPANAATYAPYTVEFVNPSDSTVTDVTGLLGSACTGQTGRAATGIASAESTQVWITYNLTTSLAAGTFVDTLTITMTPN